MPSLIPNTQRAFIGCQQILGLVLIANEAVGDYQAKKKKYWILKLDIKEAFDRWSFLESILTFMSFHPKWVDLIDAFTTWKSLVGSKMNHVVNYVQHLVGAKRRQDESPSELGLSFIRVIWRKPWYSEHLFLFIILMKNLFRFKRKKRISNEKRHDMISSHS